MYKVKSLISVILSASDRTWVSFLISKKSHAPLLHYLALQNLALDFWDDRVETPNIPGPCCKP